MFRERLFDNLRRAILHRCRIGAAALIRENLYGNHCLRFGVQSLKVFRLPFRFVS